MAQNQQRERLRMVEELMKKTGMDRKEATDLLSRHDWRLQDCVKSTGPTNTHRMDTQRSTVFDTYPRVGIISPMLNSSYVPPLHPNATSYMHTRPEQIVPSQFYNHQAAVRLPTVNSSVRGGRIIPIQTEAGLIYPPGHMYISGNSSFNASSYSDRMSSQFYPRNTNSGSTVEYNQPRIIMEEPDLLSEPMLKSPAMEIVVPAEHLQESEDVFDEKIQKKPPVFNTYPRLRRGLSNIVENQSLVTEARYSVKSDIQRDTHNTYCQTFVLPDLTIYGEDFRAFLEKDLIETSTLVSLEQAGRLNWWAELRLCQRLLPMATSGDGNCLLHAASLAMWGIHDRQLVLRKELHETLTKATYKEALYRRWRYQQTMTNKQSGLVFSETEWEEEWANILHLASPIPRGTPDTGSCDNLGTQRPEEPVVYESLEEFHVFVLAHVLQRPIIVVADTILKDSNGEALAPIPFPGIYLPLEVHTCFKSPLLLTYDAAHFSALVPMEQSPASPYQLPAAIPLQDPELKLLPLHFHVDPGPHVNWNKGFDLEVPQEDPMKLLQKFLTLERIPFKTFDQNGDSDRGSCGSQDSDDTGAQIKDKDKKKKDARMTQQVNSVAKQFGSIGKTMGKKLKQLGKVGKTEKARRPSVGNEITQSTRVHSNYGSHGHGQETVLVAKLSEKRGKQQQEMIKNYLIETRQRFESDRDLKRRSDAELRTKVAPYPAIGTEQINSSHGYSMYGTSQPNGNARFPAHLPDRVSGSFIHNAFPARDYQAIPTLVASEEVVRCGNSKFYTSGQDEVNLSTSAGKHMTVTPNNFHDSRFRSPSPDYDNCSDLNMNRASVHSDLISLRTGPSDLNTIRGGVHSDLISLRTGPSDPNTIRGGVHSDLISLRTGPSDPNTIKVGVNSEQNINHRAGISSDTSTSKAGSTIQHPEKPYLGNRQKCLNSGCDFYGSYESQGLCSKCFQKKYESLDTAVTGITKL